MADAARSYELELCYHGPGAKDPPVLRERLPLARDTEWGAVATWAAATSSYPASSFALEDENGSALSGGAAPLTWVRQDPQRRPYRVAVLKRHNNDADKTFKQENRLAGAHVGLVVNVVNAGIDPITLLSESIENSVQHEAELTHVFVDRARRRVMIFDDGKGIKPEEIDAVAKAGASTVRDDSIQNQVAGGLEVTEGGAEGFGALNAEWGRYGVGRFSQLSGTQAVVTYVSKARDIQKMSVFRQSMAEMLHRKEVVFDRAVYDPATRDYAQQVKTVNDTVRAALGRAVGASCFTFVTIEGVGDAFFDDWEAKRAEHLGHLAEKYCLNARGKAGDDAREFLRGHGLAAGAGARVCQLVVDGQDLGETGPGFGDDIANRVADLAVFAQARENPEQKAKVVRWSLTEAGRSRVASRGAAPRAAHASLAALSLYFPHEQGQATLPEAFHGRRGFVFWNGLLLRDESLLPWWLAPPATRGRVAAKDSKLDGRTVNCLFIESVAIFSPEVHKRHLRPGDAGYMRVALKPPEDDDVTPRLRAEHRAQLEAWSRAHDQDECYPNADGDAWIRVTDTLFLRSCPRLLLKSEEYGRDAVVEFSLGKGKDAGVGRVLRFYAPEGGDAANPEPGFFVCASPLAPKDDDADQGFVDRLGQHGAELQKLRDKGPRFWWRERYVACPSALISKRVEAADAVKKAANRFPARVWPTRCGEFDVHAKERKLQKDQFDDFSNTVYSGVAVPEFRFILLAGASKKKGLGFADCEGLELELMVARPEKSWEEAPVATATCDRDLDAFVLRHPDHLDEVGAWQWRARLKNTEGALWTALSENEARPKREQAFQSMSLDDLCKREGDLKTPAAAAFSRALACKLNPSEPIELRIAKPGGRRRGAELGAALDLTVKFFDVRGAPPPEDDKQTRVDGDSYAVTGRASRAWAVLDGNEVEFDLSGCALAAQGSGEAALTGVVIPARAVPPNVTLPVDVEVHLSLEPVTEERFQFVAYDVDLVPGPSPGLTRRFRCLGEAYDSLAAMESAIAQEPELRRWLVPRTLAPLEMSVTAAPSELRVLDASALTDMAPGATVEAVFELMSEWGHAVIAKDGADVAVDVVGGGDADARLNRTRLEGSLIKQEVRVEAGFGWAGALKFTFQGCEAEVRASVLDRQLEAAVLVQDAGEDEDPRADDANWAVVEGTELPPADLATLAWTWLRVTVRDGNGAIDTSSWRPGKLNLVLPTGARAKVVQAIGVVRGALVVSLAKLGNDTRKHVAAARAQGLMRLEVEVPGEDGAGLKTRPLELRIKAGAPASVHVIDPDHALAHHPLKQSEPAPPLPLEFWDATETVTAQGAAGLTASLSCTDANATLVNVLDQTPLLAEGPEGEPGVWLPGGWAVETHFDPESAKDEGFYIDGALEVRISGFPDGGVVHGVVLQTFRSGDCEKLDLDGPTSLDLERGQAFDAPRWRGFDRFGNRFDGYSEGDTAGIPLKLEGAPNLKLVKVAAPKARGRKKKSKAAPEAPETNLIEAVPSDKNLYALPAGGRRLCVQTIDGAPLNEPVACRIVLDLPEDFPKVEGFSMQSLGITVGGSSAPAALSVFPRVAGLGEAFPSAKAPAADDDWGAPAADERTPLAAGAEVRVAYGFTPLLDVLQFEALDERGAAVEPAKLEEALQWKAGSEKWRASGDLCIKKPVWLRKVAVGESCPVVFSLDGGATTCFELSATRKPGDPKRLVLQGPPPQEPEPEPEAEDEDADSPSSRLMLLEAWDSEKGGHRCPCSCRLTCSLEELTSEGADGGPVWTSQAQLPHSVGVAVAHWNEDKDARDAVEERVVESGIVLDVDDRHALNLEVRLVDLTENGRPVDHNFRVAVRVQRDMMEDDEDGPGDASQTVTMGLLNARGEAERRRKKTEEEAAGEARVNEFKKREKAVERAAAEHRRLAKELEDTRAAREAREQLRAERDNLQTALGHAQRAVESRQAELDAATAARDAGPRRKAALSTEAGRDRKLARFKRELVRALGDRGLARDYVGFLSDLGTVEDDADAECIAHLCGTNHCYVRSRAAARAADEVASTLEVEADVLDLSNAHPGPRELDEEKLRREAKAGATPAILRVICSPKARSLAFYKKLSKGRAEIFDDAEAMDAACDGPLVYNVVSRDKPGLVFRAGGAVRVGRARSRPPAFAFGSPATDDAAVEARGVAVQRAEAEVEKIEGRLADDELDHVPDEEMDDGAEERLSEATAAARRRVEELRAECRALGPKAPPGFTGPALTGYGLSQAASPAGSLQAASPTGSLRGSSGAYNADAPVREKKVLSQGPARDDGAEGPARKKPKANPTLAGGKRKAPGPPGSGDSTDEEDEVNL